MNAQLNVGEAVAAWMLHRFGPDSPEGREAAMLNEWAAALAAPKEAGDGAGAEDVRRLQECESAWMAIVETLDERSPGWRGTTGRCMDHAVNAIRRLAAPSKEAATPQADQQGDDLVERFRIALNALIRERKVYAEDVYTLGDVLRVLERIAALPTLVVDEAMIGRAYSAFVNAKIQDPADTRSRLGFALRAAAISATPDGAPQQPVSEGMVTRAMDGVLPNGHRVWAYVGCSNPDPEVTGREVLRVALASALGGSN